MTLKRKWSDGTTGIVFSPIELVERLVAIIPPPKVHQILYRGVLAGNSALRNQIVPRPREEPAEDATERRAKRL